MTEQAAGTLPELIALREHASALAAELPGALRCLTVRSGDQAIEVEWQPAAVPATGAALAGGLLPGALPPAPATVDASGDDQDAGPGLELVLSPMVGTFYRAPEPGAEPFVQVGDAIDAGGVVGIVEAMKLMNPIHTEVAGVVTDVLVANAETVEFGQPLIAVEPAS